MTLYNVNSLPAELVIGRQTETGVLDVKIDCAAWLAIWPELVLSIWVTPPGGAAAYPATTHMEGDVLVWDVNGSDTAVDGNGTMEVMGLAEGLKKLSSITTTKVLRTTTEITGDPPDPAQAWADNVIAQTRENAEAASASASSANQAKQAATDSAAAAAASAKEAAAFVGKPGADGISPKMQVAEIDGGHRVTITDAYGVTAFDVMDGQGDFPELYGAAGDGTTDDYAAFVALLADAKANNRPVYIPARSYYLSKPIIADAAQISGDYGLYTGYRIITTQQLDLGRLAFNSVRTDTRANFITDSDTWYLQGMEWVGPENAFLVGFRTVNVVPGQTEALLAKYNAGFEFVSATQINAGHCNDLAYNKENGLLYIATADKGINANKIIVVDPADCSVVGAYSFDRPCYQVGYDEVNRCLIANFGSLLRWLDYEGNILEERPLGFPDDLEKDHAFQSMLVLDGQLFFLASGKYSIIMAQIDYATGTACNYLLKNIGAQEVEAATVKDGRLYVIAGQALIRVYSCDLANGASPAMDHLTSVGETLPTGADLSIYARRPGKWVCGTPADAATMANLPSTYVGAADGAFTMWTEATGLDRFRSVLVTNSARIFYSQWSPYVTGITWRELLFEGDYRTGRYTINGAFGGFTTSNGTAYTFTAPNNGRKYKTTPRVLSGNIAVRQNGNYLLPLPTSLTGDAVSSVTIYQSDCGFMFEVKVPTAHASVINNDNCAVWCNFTITDE